MDDATREAQQVSLRAAVHAIFVSLLEANDLESATLKLIKSRLREQFGEAMVDEHRVFIKEATLSEAKRIEEEQLLKNSAVEEEDSSRKRKIETSGRGRKKQRREVDDDDIRDAGEVEASDHFSDGESDSNNSEVEDSDAGGDRRRSSRGPRKPRSAFLFYSAEHRERVRDELQRSTGDTSFGALNRAIGEEWKRLSPEDRREYDDMAVRDRLRYKREMDELRVDNPELYQELMAKPVKKSRASSSGGGASGAFEKLMKAARPSRKVAETDPIMLRAWCEEFRNRLENAAARDRELSRAGQLAAEKLKLCADLEAQMRKIEVSKEMLDRNILGVMNNWLQPYEDGRMQSETVRAAVYRVLDSLPVYDDDSLLKSEGLGITLLGLHPHEIPVNKRLLERVILVCFVFLLVPICSHFLSSPVSSGLSLTAMGVSVDGQTHRLPTNER